MLSKWALGKVAGIISGNHEPVDLSCKSMDLYRVADHNLDSVCIVDHESQHKKICFKSWIPDPANL